MSRRLLLVIAASLQACVSFGTFMGTGEEVNFADSAEENMMKGQAALAAKNHAEAAKYFEFVRSKFPFLEASKDAELLLADTDYDRERWVEARDRYLNFGRLHPTHPKLDYAAFRAAVTHYKDIPTDFFLLPPSSEKDQIEVKSALTAMNDFLRTYPKSSYQPEAKKIADDVKRRLADHELYVVEFYASRDRWPAVIGRLNTVATNFTGIGLEERVYLGLYEAHTKLNESDKANAALRTLIEKAPDSAGAKKAQKLLALAPTPAAKP